MTDSQNLKIIILIGICLIFCITSLAIGDTGVDWSSLFNLKKTTLQQEIFSKLRLPHTLNAFAVGGLLALAGFLMQSILANPLADPYTLGSSGGAAVFTLLAMLLGFEGSLLILASFIGALSNIVFLSFILGRLSQVPTAKLLLIGIVLAAAWGALLSLLLIIMPTIQTKPILFWLFGDIDYQHYLWLGLIGLLGAGLISLFIFDDLALTSQGVLLAKTLGVETEKLQLIVLLLCSFITATAVSLGGTIGFVGLIIPHCARLLHPRPGKKMILYVIFLGGTLLLLADCVARIIIAPEQLPIGLVTTIIGIPFYLYLAKRYYG